MEQQNFTFGEKKTLCVDDILAIKNGERVAHILGHPLHHPQSSESEETQLRNRSKVVRC